jgi:outer membrane protein assembly factor BamB
VSTTLLVMLAWSLAAEPTGVWPGFLGAGASPVASESLPLEWSPAKNIAWKADLPGHGQSSPVVYEGRVFVTAIEGPLKDKCHVLAFDLATGKQAWKHTFESSDKVKNTVYVSRAAPTPVADAQGVYAFFESGDVVALAHDGTVRWTRSLGADYGKFKNKFGLAASPVMTEKSVILLIDDEGPSYLIALAKQDGKNLWKTDRTSRVSWSSPAVVPVEGSRQVVCSSAGSVDGYDPETGALLWSFTEVGGNTSTTPMPIGPGQFLVAAAMGRDGENSESAKKSNLAMAIEQTGGKPAAKVLWRTEEALASFSSPIVAGDYAYWLNRAGVVFCFDRKTGEKKYAERLKQGCWATPLVAGDRIYFVGKDGLTSVIATGPQFNLLAENMLWDPAAVKRDPNAGANEETEERKKAAANFASPIQYGVAAVNGSLLIRTGDGLYCLRKP